jgi:hypothetical protein
MIDPWYTYPVFWSLGTIGFCIFSTNIAAASVFPRQVHLPRLMRWSTGGAVPVPERWRRIYVIVGNLIGVAIALTAFAFTWLRLIPAGPAWIVLAAMEACGAMTWCGLLVFYSRRT